MPGLADLIAGIAQNAAPSDPNDFSDRFNTALSPDDERKFRVWQSMNPRLGNTYDYDARGFWKAGRATASNGHGGDTWKKPNHPTFSTYSQYSTPQEAGGTWVATGKKNPDGQPQQVFWGAPRNLKGQSVSELSQYFKDEEPGNQVVMPISYYLPAGRR